MKGERAIGGPAHVRVADVRARDQAHQRKDDIGVGRGGDRARDGVDLAVERSRG